MICARPTQHGHSDLPFRLFLLRLTIDSTPSAKATVGANNGVKNAGMLFERRILHYNGILDPDAGADIDEWSNGDVGPNLGGCIDPGRGVDIARTHNVRSSVQ